MGILQWHVIKHISCYNEMRPVLNEKWCKNLVVYHNLTKVDHFLHGWHPHVGLYTNKLNNILFRLYGLLLRH